MSKYSKADFEFLMDICKGLKRSSLEEARTCGYWFSKKIQQIATELADDARAVQLQEDDSPCALLAEQNKAVKNAVLAAQNYRQSVRFAYAMELSAEHMKLKLELLDVPKDDRPDDELPVN